MPKKIFYAKGRVKKDSVIVHYKYILTASTGKSVTICGQKKPYATTKSLSLVTCKRCKKVIRGMLRG